MIERLGNGVYQLTEDVSDVLKSDDKCVILQFHTNFFFPFVPFLPVKLSDPHVRAVCVSYRLVCGGLMRGWRGRLCVCACVYVCVCV